MILSFITGDKHERLVEELIDSILICGNADDAVINKGVACSSDEIGRSENVGDHDGLSIDLEIEDERKLHLVDVELEMAVHTASGDSHVVAHNLRADHRNGLDLGRVNLAGHDGRSGLVLGKVELAETASRSRSEKSHVVGNFVDGAGDDVQGAGSFNHGVVVGQRLELVWRGNKWKTSVVGELFAASFGEADSGVESGAHSSAANSELVNSRQTGLDSRDAVVKLLDVAGELLAESQRRRVHHMCSANLDDVLEFLLLGEKRIAELLEAGKQNIVDFKSSGDVHRGRISAVRRLRLVHVIVGVDGRLGADLAAEKQVGAVRNDLVAVHVRLRTGTSLEDDKRKVTFVVELAGDDLVGCLLNRPRDLLVKTELHVRLGTGLLQVSKGLIKRS